MTDRVDPDAVVGAWREGLERGESTPAEEVVALHPEIADELRARFAAVEMLDAVFAEYDAAEPPTRIGEFKIVREIARGGMGVVYEALQESMRRPVALKVLYPSFSPTRKAVARFQQEARAAGRLKHTNIVAVHQLGQDQGLWFAAMDLVDGPSINRVIGRESLTGKPEGSASHYLRLARMFAGLADALQVAHDHGIVHRDVKPANILLDGKGELRLLDFGLARLDDATTALTGTTDRLGTPLYMSPEQFRGPAAAVDHRADIYSLGATLYEALASHPPFEGDSSPQLASRVLHDAPEPLRRRDRRIPRDLETIVHKALRKRPEDRYADAASFADDLRSFALGQGIAARRIGPLGRAWRRMRRNKLAHGLAAALVGVVAAAVVLLVRVDHEASERRALEYDALLRAAVAARAVDDTTEGVGKVPGAAAAVYTRAIQLDGDRPDAWLGRVLSPGRSLADRMADLDAARARGLAASTTDAVRAHLRYRYGSEKEAGDGAVGDAIDVAPDDAAALLVRALDAVSSHRHQEALEGFGRVIALRPPASVLHYLARRGRARVLLRMQRFEDALADLYALRAAGDTGVLTLALAAVAWRGLGNEAEANSIVAGVLALSPATPAPRRAAWVTFCNFALDAGHWDWIERVSKAGVEQYPDEAAFHAWQGAIFGRAGKWDRALAAFDAALKQDDQRGWIHAWKARTLQDAGRPKEAGAALDRARELHPEDSDVLAAQTVVLRAQGRLDASLAAAREGQRLNPTSTQFTRELAVTLIVARRYDEARAALDSILCEFPGDGYAWGHLAVLEHKTGRDAEALKAIAHADQTPARDAFIEICRGLAYEGVGQDEQAVGAYREAVRLQSVSSQAWRALGSVLMKLGRLDEAAEAFAHLVAMAPSEAEGWFGRGTLEHARGNLEEARRFFERAIELDPEHLYARLNLAGIRIDQGEPLAGLAIYDGLLNQGVEQSAIHFNRALALRRLGRRAEALEAYDQALQLEAGNLGARLGRAALLHEMGRYAAARDALLAATKYAPGDSSIFHDLGLNHRKLGARSDAREALKHAVELDEGNDSAHHLLGHVLGEEERYEEALVPLRRAVELRPDLLPYRLSLASYLVSAEKHDQAIDVLMSAAARFPQVPTVHGLLAWVLASSPDPELRRPEQAVESARRAAQAEPGNGFHALALGLALYRARRTAESLRALEKAQAGQAPELPLQCFRAMALQAAGRPAEALKALRRAESLFDEQPEQDGESTRFLSEARSALGRPAPDAR